MKSPRLYIGFFSFALLLGHCEANAIQPVLVERCADPSVDLTSNESFLKAVKDSPRIARVVGTQSRLLLRLLLLGGENPNVCALAFGSSALSISVESGDLEEVRLLLDNGAHPDKPLDYGGGTPLFSALSFAHYDIARLLLSKGANARHISDAGLTALHALALGSRTENSKVREQQIALAQQLISLGLSVDVRDVITTTPLILAVVAENRDLAAYFLSKGANANARNKRGQTALDYAKQKQRDDIVKLLREHGAKP